MSSSEGFSDDDFIVSSASSSPKAKRHKPAAKPTRKTPPASNGSAVNNSENGTTRSSTANNVNVSDQYQKLSQLEHILKRPDTYIGSVEKHESEQWIYNKETESMERKVVSIVPGLFKIFDEILVNAADNKIRDPSMKNIEVTIKPEENLIEVKNDGKGIPVQIHDKEHIYIPELIFGNLLTSSNYNDDQKKVTGGRNGYGAKLCNIFSTEFIVETYDKSSGKLYTQRWSQNMGKTDKPVIKSIKKATEYTKVSFRPDLAKFNMTELDEDILGVLRRRVFDLCGSVRDISVKLNGEKLKIRNFKQYVEMYVKALEHKNDPIKTEDSSLLPPPSSSSPSQTIVYQTLNDRWEIAFAVSDSTFNQVSFVNSIATTSGGTHVNFIADQIVKKIEKEIKTKNKKAMIKPFQIKNNMFLFINCLVENPAFTSQTKEQLTTRASQFGGKKTEVPDDFIKKILRTGIVDAILDIAAMNADKALKKNDGSRKNRITGYPKLEDANKAGTKEGYKCTLILTEGDSASSLAVAGLAVVGRDYYGVYPLRGKMLNVREASADQIMKNAEIQAIKQIMGFQHKKNYTPENINSLRYGHIMIMTDQDHDGSHIKGLIINFLESSFPGLLKVPNFLLEFITPIVKVTITSGPEKRKVIPFYSMPEYEAWREQNTESFKQKYYKGLGTSLAEEMREYFSQLDKHMKTFHALQDVDPGFIDLAFSKKKADDRKEWLRGFEPGVHLDPDLSIIPISDFINKELILFSMADNIRSIPSMLDGFKPSQRKILYGCYKRNLRSEIKVSQLAGYIGEHSAYHHGDQSLIQSIIGLAQDFVGSNNLNLLQPIGGFGSRAQGGKDASAARYIFTDLSKITRKIFHVDDNPLLNYLQDDEQTVEPEWYLPIVPMLLINGSEGIGTGWSTNIPPFNPVDIVANIRRLMDGQEMEEMIPWYRGWNGSITKISADKFRMEGNIEQIDDETIEITEIPAKTWTINMKEFLLNGIAGSEKQKSWIKDMEEQHGMDLKFVITLTKEEMKKSLQMGLKERFKLITTINVGNMVAFDAAGKIKKYDNVNEIIEDYYHVRLDFYQRRKDHLAEVLGNQLEKISSQARFVKMIIENELRVNNRKRIELIEELQRLNFPKFSKDGKPIWQQVDQEEITEAEIKVEEEEEEEIDDENLLNKSVNIFASYDYLLGMPIWSLTRERYHKLLLQKAEKEDQLTELLKLSAKQIWNKDLEVFLEEWHAFLKEDEEKRASSFKKSGPAAKKKRVRRVKKENDENDPDFGSKKPKTVAKKVLNPKTKPKSASLMGSLSDITSELDKNLESFVDLT
ncbi:DNA topoisomerase 2 [Komagataella phaffii CBS 7435]|uniref:DNA topoisomerase 2 n=1 Tax=Komagataella phaffii (strain ATCC 76273 / CBS 7435 / CECT 11047 / NRRL Y-11430 / Wegner 21-1) TaxID=981350 RepID=F2QWR7_KOMPC|nr:GQ67_03382T0 [Komagataella phaffii]AOA68730.1 GQ68_03351T0 [Komagataella phaffii GS115]CAH2449890.1 DNA topoisomerase 2 [Komagataella phaffii CBS 7435]CCA39845.1 DNA topoisomerase 2 [Komagataella phaffii CBS 7435]